MVHLCRKLYHGLDFVVNAPAACATNPNPNDDNEKMAAMKTPQECDKIASVAKTPQEWDNRRRMLVVAGGVASNRYLIESIRLTAGLHGFETQSPPLQFCTGILLEENHIYLIKKIKTK
jgi:tRNA A37 threonylcarbamoyltransferase TsaD